MKNINKYVLPVALAFFLSTTGCSFSFLKRSEIIKEKYRVSFNMGSILYNLQNEEAARAMNAAELIQMKINSKKERELKELTNTEKRNLYRGADEDEDSYISEPEARNFQEKKRGELERKTDPHSENGERTYL